MLGTKVIDKICIVPGCSAVGKKLYRVPKGKLRWLEWKRACPFLHDIDEGLLSHARICQVHFDAECFGETNELKLEAVPSLHLPSHPHKRGNISVISSSNTVISTGRWSSKVIPQYKCILCGQSQSSFKDSKEKLILLRFPLDVPSCREWVKFVGLKHLAKMTVKELNTNVFLCQNHFKPSGKHVPSINLPNHALEDSLLTKFGLDTKKVNRKVPAFETEEDLSVKTKCVLCLRNTEEGLILSKFPLDPKTCRLWVKHVGIHSLAKMSFKDLNDKFYLCEKHFKPDCIHNGVLLEKSVPTLNLPHPPLADNFVRTNFGMAPQEVKAELDELNTTQIKIETDAIPAFARRSDKADEVLTLFLSYAGTFRKFQKKFQAMLKLDLAKIFSRYEMKNAAYVEERKKLEEAERRKKFRYNARSPLSACNNSRPKFKPANVSAPFRVSSAPEIAPEPVEMAPESPSNESITGTFISSQPLNKKVKLTTDPIPILNKAVDSSKNYSRVKKKVPVSFPKPVKIAPRPQNYVIDLSQIYTQPKSHTRTELPMNITTSGRAESCE